ncbi:MAG TPA: IPT/TIG domain-containing protein, partial [Cyclobacteriaceae bacterium]|nr:IPT/TIG domain-containing protein [Cyclobacteriaceae bacterium]
MRKIISLIAISWLLFLINCAEEEVPVLPYPVIDTNDVTEINSEGATFNAKIISFGKEPILEFGFYWERRSSYTGPPANTQGQEKIIFTGTELKGETFEARITTTLSANVIYIVRAYAKTENYYIRGEPKTFLSLGSGGPSIAEIIPSHAHIRDTVNIRGRNFSFNAFSNIVKFDQFDAKVLDATDSLLTIVVPHQLINKKPVISVSIVGNISKLEEKFELYTPIIQSISKSTLYSLDTIELTGQHFGILPLDNKILINENEATVLSSSRTKLKFIVPLKLSNPITIQLSVAGQIATLDEDIQYLIPVFDSFSPSSAHWGDTITISGDNFYSPNLITQEVFVGTRKATIISADSDKIKFIVPNHLDVQTSKVKMITAGFELENENDLQLLEPKINHISHDQVTFEQLITLKGVGFNSNFSYLSANNHSCQITKISASEITFKIPNTLNTNNGVINLRLNSGNTIIYSLELPAALNLLPPIIESFTPHELQNVGQQITITGQNFSPSVQNNIVRLGDRNLTIRNASTTQLNVEIPSNFISNNRISAFYQNNLTLHTAGQSVTTEEIFTFNYQAAFTRLANFPGELRQHPVSFTIGNKSYMGLGTQNNLALNDLWEYDFETDTWTQKSDFPGTLRRFAKGFGFNGYGYVGFGIAS